MDIYKIRNELTMGKSIYDIPLRVVFYARVSTDKTDQLNSLKNQVDYYNGFFITKPNWTLIRGYIDEGISGTSSEKREDFMQMINDAKNNSYDLIITKEVSRFARNTLDTLKFTRELLNLGVGVFFQSDNINTLSTDGELRLTIMSSLAQDESRKLSERVKWGHKRGKENNHIQVNNRTWGYKLKGDGGLEIEPKEAEMIREIYRLFIEGYGARYIANLIYDKGYKNNKGHRLSTSTIKRIIETPRNKGYNTRNVVSTIDFLSKKRLMHDKSDYMIYKDTDKIPPIISEEIWNEANNQMKIRSDKFSKKEISYSNKYKYSGKIKCSIDGETYWRTIYKYKSGNKELWQCKNYRNPGVEPCKSPHLYTHELDYMMLGLFKEIFNNKESYIDKISKIYSMLLEKNDTSKEIMNLNKTIEKIKDRKNKLLDLSLDGALSKEEFQIRNEEFNNELNINYKKIEELEKANLVVDNGVEELKKIKEYASNFIKFNGDITSELIDTMVNKIEICWGEFENTINLKIFLKTGVEYPIYYKKSSKKNICSLPIIHIDGYKQMCEFERRHNNQPYKLSVRIEDILIA